ncbi:HipA-like protein [Planifilum fimeticola]|uniref:HipA-like protein n=1 Tax=Planifilum fimeticola TaxID=201975 RepID=A0A2T0LE65_9BACL|nr:HipA family kinase [Planifilum fimeticola]PRX40361.1 HipA-like protein [Planifilum fimeticola]
MTIRPVKHIRGMPRGSSRPQLILFSDGRHYIVKFKNNPVQGTRALVNEYVAGRLAQLLGLPVPPFKIVHISKHFFKENPVLFRHRFLPGHQFASEYIPDCLKKIDKESLSGLNIVNRRHLAGIIVFDQWVNNVDRRRGNILLRPLSGNRGFWLYMIDQGHSFSYYDYLSRRRECRWTPAGLRILPQKLKSNAFYRWCKQQSREEDFAYYLDKIQQLSEQQIRQVIASIPKDWNVSRVEREALYKYLIRAKKMLPDLIKPYLRKTDEQAGPEENAHPFLSKRVRVTKTTRQRKAR